MTSRGGSQQELRAWNLRRLLDCLAQGPLPQIELAAASGLSEATVSNLVKVLLDQGKILLEPGVRNGRRTKVLRLRGQEASWHLGVDLGRTAIRVASLTASGDARVHTAEVSAPYPYSHAIDTVAGLVARFTEDGLPAAKPSGAVVAVPGLVRTGAGTPPGLLGEGYHQAMGWGSVPLAKDLAAALGVDVAVENDCNLAALAEMHEGAAQPYRDFMYLYCDTYVGGALVLDGRIYRGGGGAAGEFGHTSVDTDGRPCWCGGVGCLETVIGGAALVEAAGGGVDGRPTTVEQVVEAARAGDEACRDAVARAGTAIGGLAGTVATPLDLGCVVVGGALAGAGSLLLDAVRTRLTSFVGRLRPSTPEVAVAALDADAVLRGAALAARQAARAS
ncbi:ROK family transcriptional regulator [Yinghuangia seranimata]|uniref:ROK family transcriptional regulator n=1 Tax=Yinghuangia seranimata TaxID=408067 RepID=UPI00248A9AA9|nr:ROK family transcriptional regulator [Yinghuangia seranimata]